MSESRHTPGPWEVSQQQGCRLFIVGRDEVLAEIFQGDLLNEELFANAALIATVPELLEALKKAHVLVQMAYKTPEWLRECRSEESDDALAFIQCVLAAACGEAVTE